LRTELCHLKEISNSLFVNNWLTHNVSKSIKNSLHPAKIYLFARMCEWVTSMCCRHSFFLFSIDEHNGWMNDRRKVHKHVSTFQIVIHLSLITCAYNQSLYMYIKTNYYIIISNFMPFEPPAVWHKKKLLFLWMTQVFLYLFR